MIKNNKQLSIARQCGLLQIQRSSYYYKAKGETAYNQSLMKIIDRDYLQYPFYGSRQMTRHLIRQGHHVSRKRIRRLMRAMNLMAIYRKPNTSQKNKAHKIYPYLLKGLTIDRPNQVWCSDITYIPIKNGFMYLVAIKDWYSRAILSWRLSNSMDVSFCINALQDALHHYGKPEIFNTDQGAQFTSPAFTDILKQNHIHISMDGKGRWVDNVFIERVWRSLKYECIYLNDFESASDAKHAIADWFAFYNNKRPHSAFHGQSPLHIYKNSAIVNHALLNNQSTNFNKLFYP
jgi:putative transposase